MTEPEDAGPRRSQRERKKASHFVSVNSAILKRKRSEETTDEDDARSQLSDLDEAGSADGDLEEEDDAPKPKRRNKGKAKATENGEKVPPVPKKPRTMKASAPRKAPKKTVGAPRGRRKAAAPNGVAFDAEQIAKDTKIATDNALFNTIMNPSAALQSTAEDFLESLDATPGLTQAELINCILRSCGCNDTVNEDEVVDYDGIVDALDNFTEVLKQEDSPIYPLTSKLPAFKKFRKSLSEFISRLVSSAAALGQLYNSDLLPTLLHWVVAMSSSQLRAFRHTATVIALEVETALCEVAAEVEKEAEVVSRQREGERKRKKGKTDTTTARDKDLEKKAEEVRDRRKKLSEFLKEFVDGVFVHRYRDLDPNIRAECVRAMGLWFSKYPSHFLDGAYLRYVGWVLSDSNTHVRLEAVKALHLAYAQTEYIGIAALQHFTERFKPRLVEMAVGDTELSVRVAVVGVLQSINTHGLLEDEQMEKLCLLIFDEETKIRKAVSGFVKGVWEEGVEERLVGKRPSEKDKQKAGVKVLATLLVQWGKALDSSKGDEEREEEDDQSNDESGNLSRRTKGKAVAALVSSKSTGRIGLAVEALWDEVEPVSDWETLLEVLLLDHSASGDDSSTSSRDSRTQGKKMKVSDSVVDEAWRLEEVEEGVLLEVLIASLRKTKADAAGSKKGEEDTVSSDITRALLKALPRLFMKYQTDENRMANVLLIPQLMNLNEYLEMRMMTAYATLWDDVTKQFLSHSSPTVLTNAVATIRYMLDTTSLSNTNSTKVLELEDELANSLREAISGHEELEMASFDEDEILAISAVCARIATLAGTRDMIAWMEEDEGGKQSSAWDIISALAERGRLGYKEEETMIEHALQVLYLHILWKTRALTASPDPTPDEVAFRERLKAQLDSLLEKLLEFAVGTQSNTAEGVRRAAFQNLMHLHILFCPAQSVGPDGKTLPTAALALSLDDEVQYRCAGFVQAEIERYAEELEENSLRDEDGTDNDESDSDGSDHENNTKTKKGRKGKGKETAISSSSTVKTSASQLEKEYIFIGVIATFLRAIKAGAIHFRHAATLLAHYGRLGPVFDMCSKVIVDILREEGMYKDNGEAVAAVIVQALRDSFTLYLDGMTRSEEHTVALAKLLSSCFIIRGAQLSVVRRLDPKYVVEVHTGALSWIGKHLATYEAAKNKKGRNKALTFFKALTPLCVAIDGRDFLQVKAHLDQVIAQAKIEVLPTAKAWDGYRAYDKRLTTGRDKAAGSRPKRQSKKGAKAAEIGTTEDEGGEEGQATTGDEAPAVAKSRPKPRRTRRNTRAAQSGDEEEQMREEQEQEHNDSPLQPEVSTPRPESRQAAPQSIDLSPTALLPVTPQNSQPIVSSPFLFATPGTSTRKRARTPDTDSEPEASNQSDQGDDERNSVAPETPRASQESPSEEIRIRRKRIRH